MHLGILSLTVWLVVPASVKRATSVRLAALLLLVSNALVGLLVWLAAYVLRSTRPGGSVVEWGATPRKRLWWSGVSPCRATERARLNILSAKAAAERIEQELARMSRERLLPDEKTLEKVARYEAHLSRLLHKALHELEAMQTRRSAAVALLARLDVDGLP